ncbi:conjugal transfer protein TraQ, partial [Klebsiella pneumoniae]|nr:conjugal transfer protein TraQ [Klebsiella pneumoniae]MDM6972370.1 conjugal transfer protein TraQ [Klebsiella michiganensis]MDX7660829.1 conjugal transfer protein TraQ [Klebsiella quasipneumoniae]MCP5837574.1 conjugal transfer protein TraQ [Klebsiella pneumoniae]MCP5972444.1 conjugal transfer protein TraQ [Klebsiella pneumoniae]
MSPATLNRISKECVMRNIRFPDLDITGMWVLAVGVFFHLIA